MVSTQNDEGVTPKRCQPLNGTLMHAPSLLHTPGLSKSHQSVVWPSLRVIWLDEAVPVGRFRKTCESMIDHQMPF